MKFEELKPVIDEILKYYFNRNTRLSYDSEIQENMVAQNKGLINACCAVIGFCDDDRDALAAYTRCEIEELNNKKAELVMMGGAK